MLTMSVSQSICRLCDCPHQATTHSSTEHKCSVCCGLGHRGIYCPTRRRRTGRVPTRTERICTTCGRLGHTADKHVCQKCHSFGHRVRDCTSTSNWTHEGHYSEYHCGQSCPCCRYKVDGNSEQCLVCAALDGR